MPLSRRSILFFGIYQIGVDALTALTAAGYEIAAVVTKPDAEEVQPVAALARRLGLPVFSPQTLASPEMQSEINNLAPHLIAVAGYHQKIPEAILNSTPLGAINLHGSLLPRYRGPTPWKWAILRGEKWIGATVHIMTEQIDRGDILGQVELPIADDDTGETLFRRIAAAGAPLLTDVVGQVLAGTARRQPQDEAQASYFAALRDEDAQIDWTQNSASIRNLVRACNLRPGAWTLAGDERWRALKATVCPTGSRAEPGTLLETSTRGWRVATSSQDLWLEELSPVEPAVAEGALTRSSGIAIAPGLVLAHTLASRRP